MASHTPLSGFLSHFAEFPGTVQLAESRCQRLHDTIQGDINADVNGSSDCQGTQICYRVTGNHGRVQNRVGDGGQLTDPDGQCQTDDIDSMMSGSPGRFHSADL